MVLNILMRTRKMVMRRVIRPGITWVERKGTIKKRFHNYLRVDEEGDPSDDNEKPAREVVGDNVERHFACEYQLEARH